MARRMTSSVLVGRSQALESLLSAVDSAADGQARHVIVGGEAGVGKSRLLAEVRTRAEASGAQVLLGGCVSLGAEGLPFAAYTEIVRSLVARDGAQAVIAAAGHSAPDLARLVPALDASQPAPDQELWAQTRLYEGLLDVFRRLAERRPLVIQLEDLHWADAGTLAATSFLLRAIEAEAISIQVTYRADEVTRRHPIRPWLAEIGRDPRVERIDLQPLGPAEVGELIGHILDEPMADHQVDEVFERSDGNPFFIEELLCCRADGDESLPASLREVLFSRVDLLPDAAQRLVAVAAVGGREVEHETLVAVAAAAAADAAAVRSLVDSGLLVPTRAVDGDDAYTFRHALVQEAVYDAMLPTERRRLHRSWGEYLSDHAADADPGVGGLVQLAHHWREARDRRAFAASVAAGDRAMASFSYEVAAREFGEALLLWRAEDDAGSELDHVDLLGRHARSSYLASDFRTAAASVREALDELGDTDPPRRTLLLILLARIQWVSGDWGPATDTYELALATAPGDPPLVRLRALAGLGQVYMLNARHHAARPLLEEAIEGARAIGARDVEGHALNSLAVVLVGLGEIEAGLSSIDAALEIALELRIPDDIGRAYVNKVDMESWSAYPERALETAGEGMRVSAEWGVSGSYGAYVGFGGVNAAFELGRWDHARDLLARSDRLQRVVGTSFLYRASYVAELLACTGDQDFEPMWERAAQLALEAPPSDLVALLFLGGIEHAAFAGDHARAAEYVRQAVELLDAVDSGVRFVEFARVAAWPLAELGVAAPQADDTARAAPTGRLPLVRALAAERASQVPPAGPLARLMTLDLAEIECWRMRLEGRDTAADWQRLAADWSALGRPFRAALAHWHEAETAERAGERAGAVTALRAAHDTAAELDAAPLMGQLEVLARRMRVRLGSSAATATAPDRAYGLTRREQEVLSEVAAGRTNREIAGALFISESTAGVHVSNILGKLGVSTRTEAARVALDQGLVGDG